MSKIIEYKRHINKPTEIYSCNLLMKGDSFAIISYISDAVGKVADIQIPIGSKTLAWYDESLGFVIWKMICPKNNLIGYLFHICRDIVIEPDKIDYLDLLLDVWVCADGEIKILDRDEVEDSYAAGLIDSVDLAWIASNEELILRDLENIIGRMEVLLSR